ncbi:MAG: hypothetical protein M1840_003396 [Geoglossum simile]|nr:MAG: hypothetical protein M1840_003396 [Geoglossum simile]
MAYNSSYNPDALPAHAEPEQVAAMLSGYGSRQTGGSQGQSYQQGLPSYGKPQPAPPQQGGYGSGPGGYGSGPGGYGGGPGGYGGGPGRGRGLGQAYNQGMVSPPPQGPGARTERNKDTWLQSLFTAVDKKGMQQLVTLHYEYGIFNTRQCLTNQKSHIGAGQLTEKELQAALVNGDQTSFDLHTIRMMIRMFDTDRSGTIGFLEFRGLWDFLSAWRELFDRFDADESGDITPDEYSGALQEGNGISFDMFMQSCISLKRMTEAFKKYDEDRDGYVTLSL